MTRTSIALDVAILARVRQGAPDFTELYVGDVAELARASAKRGGMRDAWRVVDRRVKALTEAGAIRPHKKGWLPA